MSDDAVAAGLAMIKTLNLPDVSGRPGPGVPPAMTELTLGHVFGTLWNRPGLALRDRSLATVIILAAGGRDSQLRYHLHGSLHLGITPEELEEVFIHLAHYVGWPLGIYASLALAEVVAQRAQDPNGDTSQAPA